MTGEELGWRAVPKGPAVDSDAPGPECPVCRAAQQAADVLLERRAGDDQAGDDINWLTVCNTHAWQLSGQPTLVRAIAEARLRSALAQLNGIDANNGRLTRGQAVLPVAACPFCAAMTAAAQVTVSGGSAMSPWPLCVPHLSIAMEQAPGRDHLQELAGAAIAEYSTLEQELSELIRKSDYRFRDEPRGPEATAWWRAARMLAGAPGVRWLLRRAPEIEG